MQATEADAIEPQAVDAAQRRLPDFFIAGHAKCGTTAMYSMLKGHPQIFMPDVKEPRYFAPELLSRFHDDDSEATPPAGNEYRYSFDAYLDLFASARPDQRTGEASPVYLRSTTAAGRIAEVQPQARIVAIFREPASFLRSLHLQNVHNHLEDQRDLGRALELEESRRAGSNIPPRCHSPLALMYSEHVRYSDQLGRFAEHFPREQMLVLIYDDFRRDNEAAAREVLRFLDVDPAAPLSPVETSPLKSVRSPRLHRLRRSLWRARHDPSSAAPAARLVNRFVPQTLRSGRGRGLWQGLVYGEVAPPDEALMLEIKRRYRPEVEALGEYLGRDLMTLWGYDRIS